MNTQAGPRISHAQIVEAIRQKLDRLVDAFNEKNGSEVAFDAEIGHDGQPSGTAQFTIDGGGRYGAFEITVTIDDL